MAASEPINGFHPHFIDDYGDMKRETLAVTPPISMTDIDWQEDELDYGYVVERLPDGGWWHMHIGHSAYEYDCELLGRKSTFVVQVQRFRRGAEFDSPAVLLNLDGEPIEQRYADLQLSFSWVRTHDPDLIAEATYFQQEIMPLLYDSDAFQESVAKIVRGTK
jgi:hypothetical protein